MFIFHLSQYRSSKSIKELKEQKKKSGPKNVVNVGHTEAINRLFRVSLTINNVFKFLSFSNIY